MENVVYVDFRKKIRLGEPVKRGELKVRCNATIYSDDYEICAAFYDENRRAVSIANIENESQLERFLDIAKFVGAKKVVVAIKNTEIKPIEQLLYSKTCQASAKASQKRNDYEIDYEIIAAGSKCYISADPKEGIRFDGSYLTISQSRAAHQ